MIIMGKADQVMLEPFRTAVDDAAAPVLDVLSRPLSALADLATRARHLIAVYQDNRRLAEDSRAGGTNAYRKEVREVQGKPTEK